MCGCRFSTASGKMGSLRAWRLPPSNTRCIANARIQSTRRNPTPTRCNRSSRRVTRQSMRLAFPANRLQPSRLIQPGPALFRWTRGCNRWASITCGVIIVPSQKRRRLPRSHISNTWRRLSGAVGCTRTNGVSPRCYIGCGTIQKSARSLPVLLSIAIWSRPRWLV